MARVLFVNDDEDLALVCKLTLEAHGHIVTAVIEAEPALVLARDWDPDVIIVDYQLQHGWTGAALTRILRRRLGLRMPIVMISSEPDVEALAREAGIDEFIPKPFASTDLEAAIHRWTRAPLASAPTRE